MRIPPNSTDWHTLKEEGRVHYSAGNYELALTSYRNALGGGNCPEYERQILLSNAVACRLKLGGMAQWEAALVDARQCVECNERWAKGHVRLASVYVAMGRSNDACNALQRALQLDSTNQTARRLLTTELRRGTPSTSHHTHTTDGFPEPSAPPMPVDPTGTAASSYAGPSNPRNTSSDEPNIRPMDRTQRPDDIPPPTTSSNHNHTTPTNTSNSHSNTNTNTSNNTFDGIDVDGDATLYQRLQFRFLKSIDWYHSQPEDYQTVGKFLLGLLVLYVAFGGRFGLDSSWRESAGNYGQGNAYDRFHASQQRTATRGSPHSGTQRRGASYATPGSQFDSQNTGAYSNAGYDSRSRYDDYDTNTYSNSRSSSSSIFPSLDEGSLLGMAVIAVVMYGAQRMGISPWQALMMLRAMTGRRGYGGMYGG
eukprot:CAMPEP_0194368994 /NCGR_PEP_ID=MMETSP0174-20130528/17249_1 /TAXON_ID=216777 /ORGANISM="Proboscia alata, Strain PI-D3" /LENGTH=422 /DNA_ID=CAMNT_0039145661 /DNA_START=1 /DNA_END=1265 /DNA_ORIENTATION=+